MKKIISIILCSVIMLGAYSVAFADVNIDSIFDSSSGGDSWHYNTGTNLPQEPNYSKYNLLENCKKGDILFEAKGNYGITGHSAIVEGKFYDPIKKKYYIRIVEALSYGVSRSVLDDDRIDAREGYLFRLKNVTASEIDNAVEFCLGQLGKPYKGEFSKDFSPDEKDWYCSELIWAGYKNQGIDIETDWYLNEPGVSPRDITKYSNKVKEIDITK